MPSLIRPGGVPAALLAVALYVTTAVAAPEETGDFDSWLVELHTEAQGLGISEATLDSALTGLAPLPRVIELDRKQPEFTLTFAQYLARVITPARVEEGRAKFRANASLLKEVGERYGVQPRFIVSLWGIETGYGRHTGGFGVIAALATLAHDGRRSGYFRLELLNALRIIEDGHITAAAMKGSWAGAMGQSQFMPSSFRRFAVDYDGDGRRDIWATRADVFASAANYLSGSGWKDDQTWGRRVRLPEGFDLSLEGLDVVKPLAEWQALGVRREDGRDLPTRQLPASLVLPDGIDGARQANKSPAAAFLVYDNFRTTLKWNRSTFFAIAVGRLADRIAGR